MKELEEFMETNTGSQVGMSVSAVAFSNASTVSHTSDRLLELDPGTCTDALGRQEFGIRHTVADHPLLSLEAIAELADSLPSGAVERHEANQPLLVPDGCPDLSGPPSETVRTIETNGRWMVLWNIEQVAAYRRLLDAILDEAVPFLPAREGGMGRREAFLFLSAPRAVTPVHFDPEHNFLLQIRGLKEIHVGRFPDNDIHFVELCVSRRHCVLLVHAWGGCDLHDTASRNGTKQRWISFPINSSVSATLAKTA